MTAPDYDDGLVHAHGWATEPPASAARAARPALRVDAEAAEAGHHDDHDDGLVHSHGWACGERGQKAGRD